MDYLIAQHICNQVVALVSRSDLFDPTYSMPSTVKMPKTRSRTRRRKEEDDDEIEVDPRHTFLAKSDDELPGESDDDEDSGSHSSDDGMLLVLMKSLLVMHFFYGKHTLNNHGSPFQSVVGKPLRVTHATNCLHPKVSRWHVRQGDQRACGETCRQGSGKAKAAAAKPRRKGSKVASNPGSRKSTKEEYKHQVLVRDFVEPCRYSVSILLVLNFNTSPISKQYYETIHV